MATRSVLFDESTESVTSESANPEVKIKRNDPEYTRLEHGEDDRGADERSADADDRIGVDRTTSPTQGRL